MNHLPVLCFADPDDPNEESMPLFLFAAQRGLIDLMETVMMKDPQVIFACDPFEGMCALHIAAASFDPNAVYAVRWLLEKGIPWSTMDREGRIPEVWARMQKNEESCKILRDWAINFEYELFYRSDREEDHLDHNKSFRFLRLDIHQRNSDFCNSYIWYLNPHGAPEDEVALVVGHEGAGIMMEWERPIMRETARILLDGMPTTGLRVLNIGFGIGMIDTYFQDAQPAEHVIIEGHPTCLGWMRDKGWYNRPGVRILEGRWQDFFPSEYTEPGTESVTGLRQNLLLFGQKPNEDFMVDIGKFDIVYFDTFQEGYRGHFAFIKNVPGLLRGPGSRFAYFNGHAAKAELEYQIYMEVARLHHNDLGMNTEFPSHVDPKTVWYDLQNKNQVENMPQHAIPICTLAPMVKRRIIPDVGWKHNRYTSPTEMNQSLEPKKDRIVLY